MQAEKWEMGISDRMKNQVAINGKVSISAPNGGCDLEGCNCSPGHWISIIEPLKGNTLEGVTYHFESRFELISSTIYKLITGRYEEVI